MMQKHREGIMYLLVGVLTTAVSWSTYAALRLVLDVSMPLQMAVAVSLRFVLSATASFFMNRHWVFQSDGDVWRQFMMFMAGRIGTLGTDMLIMQVLSVVIGIHDWVATVISNIVIVVTNYVWSRFVVFHESHEPEGGEYMATLFEEKSRTWFGMPWFKTYSCDDEVLHVHSGILKLRDDEIRLYRIQDIARSQGLVQRIFGLHDVELHTSDRSMGCFRMRNIRNGKQVQSTLSEAIENSRRKVGVMETGRGRDHSEEVL